MFFFGAVEQVDEDTSVPVPDRLFNELELLVAATNAGLLPPGLVNPNHPRFGPIPAEPHDVHHQGEPAAHQQRTR